MEVPANLPSSFQIQDINSKEPKSEVVDYGCSHYRRKCKIRAPCCNEIFDCRHCHNEAKNDINVDHKERHAIPRHQIQQVICTLCVQNKRCDKCVSTVVYAWENTFAGHASFLMMTYPSYSSTVMVVAFAELVDVKTFFTVTNADAVTRIF